MLIIITIHLKHWKDMVVPKGAIGSVDLRDITEQLFSV